MKKLLAITDVTHMWSDVVCIAGLTEGLQCIRPVVEGGGPHLESVQVQSAGDLPQFENLD